MSDSAPQVAPPVIPDALAPASSDPPESSGLAKEAETNEDEATVEGRETEREDYAAKEVEAKEKEVKEAELKEHEIKEAELKGKEINAAGLQSPSLKEKEKELKENKLKAQEEEAARVKEIKKKELEEAKLKWKELKEAILKERARRVKGRPSKEHDLKGKEKQRKDAATTRSPPPLPLPVAQVVRTRTFTTHAGETLTVAELAGPPKPATIPMVSHAREISSPILPPPAIGPVSRDFSAAPRSLSTADTTEPSITETSRSVEPPANTPVPAPKPIASDTSTLNSIQDSDVIDSPILLSGTDGDVGFFLDYVAKSETSLNMQVIFRTDRTDGATSQAFTDDHGNSLFTLDRRSGLIHDVELRDTRRMLVFGMHKRRFRLPRQWYVRTGSEHGIRITSSWRRRNNNLTVSFANQLGGQKPVKMLLNENKLHLRPDKTSPVVAVIEPTRVRVAKGLDMAVVCAICAVRRDRQELKHYASLRSLGMSSTKTREK